VLREVVDFELTSVPPHRCFKQLGKELTVYALKVIPSQKQPAKPPKPAKEVETQSVLDALQTEQEAIAYLGDAQSVGNKQAIEQFRKKKQQAMLDKYLKQIENSASEQRLQATIKEIYELAYAGKWREAVTMSAQLEIEQKEIYSALLMIAISTDADFAIVKSLLGQGGELSPNTISDLIKKNHVELTKALLPYGLDIGYVELDYSVLARSVEYRALDMLKFLISQDVPMDSDYYGFDALDVALKQFDLKKEGLAYVAALIEAGARVELSHQQIVERMSITDMQAYLTLISTYNELKL
ncbi:MAG: hypothetical protein MJK04_22225, partial [Psychrosphaera sp.]|nr:hypothetical protein [Psychrosphaera sp.]